MANLPQFPADGKVFYATLDTRPGFAYRDQAAACWFVEEADGARWLLHDVDRPALTLNGRVDLQRGAGLGPRVAAARTHTQNMLCCSGSLSLCDSNPRTHRGRIPLKA